MARTEDVDRDRDEDYDREDHSTRHERRSSDLAEWFAESTVRVVLAFFGVVLLLFAVGQMVGFDILGAIAAALDTRIGQWLLVAVFGLILIMIALRGFYAQPE